MQKVFCDKCKQEVTGRYFNLAIYESNTKDNDFLKESDDDIEQDLCAFCLKEVKEILKEK